MATAQLERLVEKQNKVWNRMEEIRQAAEDGDRDWTTEERTNWDTAEADLTLVSADIERLERAAKLEATDWAAVHATDTENRVIETTDEQQAEKYERAFNNYLRYGMPDLDNEQRSLLTANHAEIRAQGIGTTTAGGFLVPPGFRVVLSEVMKAYGGLLNHANVITTSTGQPLQWPFNDDTTNIGAILTENTQISAQDMVLGTRTLNAWVYTSKLVLVSLQLLQDSAFDLDTWLPSRLGTRIGRATAQHFINGTGTTQPVGIVTNATVGATGITGETLTIVYGDLINLEHSVDPAYRGPNCQYLMSDAALKMIRKLVDTMGRPLWVPIPAPGFPPTINGWPYTIDQAVPVPAANAKSILFGDFKLGYIIRQVLDIQAVRLSERYADLLQVGFFAYVRLDAAPDDPNAVRVFQHSAT
jgi:HK97 family phage major capsid protein